MIEFTGTYDKTCFRNEESGYTVFMFNTGDANEYKNENGLVVCSGKIPIYTKNMPLRIIGEPTPTKNGFKIDIKRIVEASDRTDITINYLSSEAFDGIGEKTAKKIIDLIGTDVFAYVTKPDAEDFLSDNIAELKGEKAKNFVKTIRNTMHQRKILEYIHRFGGNYANAKSLFDKFGSKAIETFKKEPYKTGRKAGISFNICDSIAKDEGIHPLDKRRIEAIINEAMKKVENAGNTYGEIDDVVAASRCVCKNSAYADFIPPVVLMCSLSNMKNIVIDSAKDKTKFYTRNIWDCEEKIVSDLLRIGKAKEYASYDDSLITKIEDFYNIQYSESQKKSFLFLQSTGIKILTGGPGTGKTTVINGLITAYKKVFPNRIITLCAPTGRAAQRMTESTNMPASTIHKLLDVKPYGDTYMCKDQSDPLPSDLIIVDEISMIDTEMLAMLLGAIKSNATVILSGDIDQLPSVGSGNVLKDLIASRCFDVNILDVVYRQNNDSSIVRNAIKIRNGLTDIEQGKDFEIIRAADEELLQETVLKLLNKYYNSSTPFNIEILSSTKRGLGGITELNSVIQKEYNHCDDYLAYGHTVFKKGDQVMTIKNNYDTGYMNGDVGVVSEVGNGELVISIGNEDVAIENKNIKDLSLAYAMTIHKSQGSEFPITIVVLPQNPYNMLKRNLVYTAITRSKNKTIIVSERDALEIAIAHTEIDKRKTSLCEKICGRMRYL